MILISATSIDVVNTNHVPTVPFTTEVANYSPWAASSLQALLVQPTDTC